MASLPICRSRRTEHVRSRPWHDDCKPSPLGPSRHRGAAMSVHRGPSASVAAVAQAAVSSPIQSYLERLHAKHAGVTDGAVATYIPELAKADPNWFGICVATADGKLY